MSSQPSDQRLGEAVLDSVLYGAFPEDDQVTSTTVSLNDLPKLLRIVGQSREQIRNEVRELSRQAGPDVDGWIEQARKLQDDIKRSQETAQEIVQQAEQGRIITAQVHDATSNVSFLQSEIAYNVDLVQALEQLRDISELLVSVQNAIVHGHITHALQTLEGVEGAFERLGPYGTSRPVTLLRNREGNVKKSIVEAVTNCWNKLVVVDNEHQSILLKQTSDDENTADMNVVVAALGKLNLLDGFITCLSRDVDKSILFPRLHINSDRTIATIAVKGDRIQRAGHATADDIKRTLEDVQTIAEYFNTNLPAALAVALSAKLVPIIASRLIADWLLPAVPTSTHSIEEFQDTLSYVMGLKEFFDELGWSGQDCLTEWVDQSAKIWLARQKEAAISSVQKTLSKRGVLTRRSVERVEVKASLKGEVPSAGKEEQEDGWGDEWGEEEPMKQTEVASKEEVEEEDMSAWAEEGDEIQDVPSKADEGATKSTESEDTEDWGAEWGDEDGLESPIKVKTLIQPTEQTTANSDMTSLKKRPSKQEVVTRETYAVTGIPDSLMEIILQVVVDVETVNSPKLVKSVVSAASRGLYDIPSLTLAMYRAIAAVEYSQDPAGNMLLYNDCQHLSDRLRLFLIEQADKDKTSKLESYLRPSLVLKPKLDIDITSTDAFGRRAYGREMESQRQIICDHLENAEGFKGCTEGPLALVCDDAIASAIDRISHVKRQWQNVLSPSALLLSLGQLVSTALTKFINHVEDMSDIAEDESKKLHGYCVALSSLSQHFLVEGPDAEMKDMVAAYTPTWFKFQYLSDILDSSLADIKYLWTEGELKLEMSADEVIGLIEALFAHSEHRRKAIAEIKRTSVNMGQGNG